MTKRFTVSLPDSIGQIIENQAAADGTKATSTAGFILETAIRQGVDDGKYPKEWLQLGDQVTEQSSEPSPAEALLIAMIDGNPDAATIAQAARALDVDPHLLQAAITKKKNGNGDPAHANV